MFVTKEGSTNCWFQAGSLSSVEEFELVGIVVGLAIYHSITLAVPLPAVRLAETLCGEMLIRFVGAVQEALRREALAR